NLELGQDGSGANFRGTPIRLFRHTGTTYINNHNLMAILHLLVNEYVEYEGDAGPLASIEDKCLQMHMEVEDKDRENIINIVV
ncbi:hypothetical protein ACJX0J_015386, partial [Zea mays]